MKTKERIFLTAMELFAKKGYDAVPVRQIARNAGIKESSIYNHFKNKYAILEQAFETMEADLKKNKPSKDEIDILTSKVSLYEFLKTGLDRYMANWENPVASKIWHVVSMEQYRNTTAARIIIEESERVMDMMQTAFGFFQQKGKMQYTDPMVLAHLYGFSQRATHLDYTLRQFTKNNPEKSRKKMYEVLNEFAHEYGLNT